MKKDYGSNRPVQNWMSYSDWVLITVEHNKGRRGNTVEFTVLSTDWQVTPGHTKLTGRHSFTQWVSAHSPCYSRDSSRKPERRELIKTSRHVIQYQMDSQGSHYLLTYLLLIIPYGLIVRSYARTERITDYCHMFTLGTKNRRFFGGGAGGG